MSKTSVGNDLPFSSQVLRFIDAYVQCQDLDKAAVQAAYHEEMGRKLWKRPLVRAEIERRLEAVNGETAKIVAKKRIVTVDALDRNLMRIVSLPVKTLKEIPTLAASKVKAIEIGYQRTGLLIDGNFIPDAGTEAGSKSDSPRIYRAEEQSIITHQITETRQTVMRRSVEASQARPSAQPAQTAPTTIDANMEDPWKNF